MLVLSQHVETTHTVDLVTRPGFGYLLKDRVLEVEEFLSAAERVAGGGSALDPHVVATLFAGRGEQDPPAALTERERTVEAHVRHLFGKLDMPESEDDHRRVLAVLAQLGTR